MLKKSNLLASIAFLICSAISMNAQEKVVILDSIQSAKIITQLINGDACKAELKIVKNLLKNEEERTSLLKEQNQLLLNAYKEKDKESLALSEIIFNDEKIIKKEKNKKTFWKYIGIVSLSLSGFLLITN